MLYEQRTEDQKVVEKVTRDLKVKKTTDSSFRSSKRRSRSLQWLLAMISISQLLLQPFSIWSRGKYPVRSRQNRDIRGGRCARLSPKDRSGLRRVAFGSTRRGDSYRAGEALNRREIARAEKNWQVADECRALIEKAGYFIEDTPQGARLKRRE